MVEAIDASNNLSLPSNFDIATTIVFMDDPPVPGSTVIKANFIQVRTAIDAVRAATGGGTAAYTNAITAGALINAIDVTEMRTYLDAARLAIGVPAIVYTNPVIAAGAVVEAADIQDLRNGEK